MSHRIINYKTIKFLKSIYIYCYYFLIFYSFMGRVRHNIVSVNSQESSGKTSWDGIIKLISII